MSFSPPPVHLTPEQREHARVLWDVLAKAKGEAEKAAAYQQLLEAPDRVQQAVMSEAILYIVYPMRKRRNPFA